MDGWMDFSLQVKSFCSLVLFAALLGRKPIFIVIGHQELNKWHNDSGFVAVSEHPPMILQ